MVEGTADERESMSALAILTCRQNSHPFQERHISLHEATKIGRSVARARPAPNNGIFDCKVLSRNHALLWYENGSFYLQDTKSSNGTFVNDQRLCKGGEESAPRECFSGDLVHFGVNVTENNRRGEKITHGCIIATLTLYHPDGREAKPALYNTPTPGITIQSQELYKLAQYLQEALHREKMLEQKLSTLQELVQNTQESSEGGWQALIDEDRLLSRLEVLENQLHAYSKNHTEDTLRQELVTLQEEKLNYETTAKESLMKVLQEKIEAVTKLSDLERSLTNTEDECLHLKDACEKTQEELQLLAEKYQDQLKEVQDIQLQLQDAETKHLEEMERVEKEKTDLSEKLDAMVRQEELLSAKVESLQADSDISKEQLAAMKARLESLKEPNEDDKEDNRLIESDQEKSVDSDNEVLPTVIIPTSVDKDQMPEDVEGKLKDTQKQIETYKTKLEESEKKLQESSDKVDQLQKELEIAQLDSRQFQAKIATLEEKLQLSDLHMNQMVESTIADLNLQLTESSKQSDNSNDLITNLQNQIEELERELSQYRIQPEASGDTTLIYSDATDGERTLRPSKQEKMHNHIQGQEDEDLAKLLKEARVLQQRAEEELNYCKGELDDTKLQVKKSTEENCALKSELNQTQQLSESRAELVHELQGQLKEVEATVETLNQEIKELQGQLDTEKTKHKTTKGELDHTKKLLTESQQAAKQTHNEAEQLRNKLRQQEEKEGEVHVRDKHDKHETKREIPILRHSYHEPHSRLPVSKHRATEFAALKEECSGLRKRIQAIEAEMKMSRRENLQLSSEYNKLQESYKELEALKQKLELRETSLASNLTDSQKETENTKQEVRSGDITMTTVVHSQLQKAKEEIVVLKKKCDECNNEITRLKGELKRLSGDYRHLASRSKLISFCSSIPLLMLLFAILLVVYPSLEWLTTLGT